MFGIVISGIFFTLKLDSYFKEFTFYKTFSKTFSLNNEKINNNKLKKTIKALPLLESKELVKNKNESIEAVKEFVKEEVNNINDVIIRKDALLNVKTIELINLDGVTNRNRSKDSLLERVSRVEEQEADEGTQFFNVEFWQSPLHYKGYKLGKYKLILYGLPGTDNIRIYKLNNSIYIKNAAGLYKLNYGGDFKSYELILDEEIIKKIKK
ncbi:MAG: hypothetical protein ABI315_07410 [Bacteroidia bacterium]